MNNFYMNFCTVLFMLTISVDQIYMYFQNKQYSTDGLQYRSSILIDWISIPNSNPILHPLHHQTIPIILQIPTNPILQNLPIHLNQQILKPIMKILKVFTRTTMIMTMNPIMNLKNMENMVRMIEENGKQ